MKRGKLLFGGAAGAMLALSASATQAAISYGTFVGPTTIYSNVNEDNQGLFGAPTLQGDTLDFGPGEFHAESSLSDDFGQFTAGYLTFVVESVNPLHYITSITLAESGIFRLFSVDEGGDPGDTFVDVSMEGVYQILAANNASPSSPIHFEATFDPEITGTFTLEDHETGPGTSTRWNGGYTITFPAEAQVTRVEISFTNSLLATSDPGTFAYIDKQELEITVNTQLVPEPASLTMLGLGAAGLLLRRRR